MQINCAHQQRLQIGTTSVKHDEYALQAMLFLAVPKFIPNMRIFRRNIATVRVEDRVMKFGIKGQSDTYAILKGGQHVEIELKSATGDLTPKQRAWQDWCLAWNVPHIVLVARKEELPKETIARWIEELRMLIKT
jgi:hypothetical protein